MDHVEVVVQVGDCCGELAEKVLGHLLNLRKAATGLLREWHLRHVLQILLHEVKDLLVANVALLLEVPRGDLSQVCHLKDRKELLDLAMKLQQVGFSS